MSKLEIGTVITETLPAIYHDTNHEAAYVSFYQDVNQLAETGSITSGSVSELASGLTNQRFQQAVGQVLVAEQNGSKLFEGVGTLVSATTGGRMVGLWHNPSQEVETRYGCGLPYAIKKLADAQLDCAVNGISTIRHGYVEVERVQRKYGLHTAVAKHHLGGAALEAWLWKTQGGRNPNTYLAGGSGILVTDAVRQTWLNDRFMAARIKKDKDNGLFDWSKDMCAGAADSRFGRAVLWTYVFGKPPEEIDMNFTGQPYRGINLH